LENHTERVRLVLACGTGETMQTFGAPKHVQHLQGVAAHAFLDGEHAGAGGAGGIVVSLTGYHLWGLRITRDWPVRRALLVLLDALESFFKMGDEWSFVRGETVAAYDAPQIGAPRPVAGRRMGETRERCRRNVGGCAFVGRNQVATTRARGLSLATRHSTRRGRADVEYGQSSEAK
jgi:hypothetical protein